jgi:hypothetical protein
MLLGLVITTSLESAGRATKPGPRTSIQV